MRTAQYPTPDTQPQNAQDSASIRALVIFLLRLSLVPVSVLSTEYGPRTHILLLGEILPHIGQVFSSSSERNNASI